MLHFKEGFWFFLFDFSACFFGDGDFSFHLGLLFFPDMLADDELFDDTGEGTGHDVEIQAGGGAVEHQGEHQREHNLHYFYGNCQLLFGDFI